MKARLATAIVTTDSIPGHGIAGYYGPVSASAAVEVDPDAGMEDKEAAWEAAQERAVDKLDKAADRLVGASFGNAAYSTGHAFAIVGRRFDESSGTHVTAYGTAVKPGKPSE